MKFIEHSDLAGKHAPFSPSAPSWLKYDEARAIHFLKSQQARYRGTRLHAWAKETIDLGIRQPRSDKTLYMYVNDAISLKMETEVVLYYSRNFFGTADAISYSRGVLRIHDLKTGEKDADMGQLVVYAALFCLEYKVKPEELRGCELRIYQKDQVVYHNPEPDEIHNIMDQIVRLDRAIKEEVYDE